MTRPTGRRVRVSRRRSARQSGRPGSPDATPVDLGEVVRQVGVFESANGLPHGVAVGIIGVVIGVVALLVRPVARLLRSVTRW